MHVVAVADTDSYLKWVSATLDGLPADWRSDLVVVQNPVQPSAAQIAAATSRPVTVLSVAGFAQLLARGRPDVVLLGCTGPTVTGLTELPGLRGRRRPVLVTGLPGISIPATQRALDFRARCDLMLLHSHREVAEFTRLAASSVPGLVLGLARLPFLSASAETKISLPGGDLGTSEGTVVFAAQAIVPRERAERELILESLARVRPTGSAVIKLRAAAGEQQTHRETWSYPELAEQMIMDGRLSPGALRFVSGSMHEALVGARALVTVSSTAALEAAAQEMPIMIISDFGVNDAMINTVFADSGCLGALDDLQHDHFHLPSQEWLINNYFHPTEQNTWIDALQGLLAMRAAGGLPRQRSRSMLRARARGVVRLILRARWRRR